MWPIYIDMCVCVSMPYNRIGQGHGVAYIYRYVCVCVSMPYNRIGQGHGVAYIYRYVCVCVSMPYNRIGQGHGVASLQIQERNGKLIRPGQMSRRRKLPDTIAPGIILKKTIYLITVCQIQ